MTQASGTPTWWFDSAGIKTSHRAGIRRRNRSLWCDVGHIWLSIDDPGLPSAPSMALSGAERGGDRGSRGAAGREQGGRCGGGDRGGGGQQDRRRRWRAAQAGADAVDLAAQVDQAGGQGGTGGGAGGGCDQGEHGPAGEQGGGDLGGGQAHGAQRRDIAQVVAQADG